LINKRLSIPPLGTPYKCFVADIQQIKCSGLFRCVPRCSGGVSANFGGVLVVF